MEASEQGRMTREHRREENITRQLRRAHDVLEGCLISLPISEEARGVLKDQLRILYEFSIYPIVAPSASVRASSSQRQEYDNASSVGDTDSADEFSTVKETI